MTGESLGIAMVEACRFLRVAKAAEERIFADKFALISGSPETGRGEAGEHGPDAGARQDEEGDMTDALKALRDAARNVVSVGIHSGLLVDLPTAERILLAAVDAERECTERYAHALMSLTPGGSEFYHSPQNCVDFVRTTMDAQMATIKRMARRRKMPWNDTACAPAQREEEGK